MSVTPESPDAGDVITYDIVLSNGGTAIPYASVSFELTSALVLEMSGQCRPSPGEGDWIIFDWAADTEQHCRVDVLSFAHDAGANARLSADISTGGEFWRVDASPLLDTPPSSPQLISGPVLLATVVLLVASIIWAVWLAPSRLRRRLGPSFTLAIAGVFLMFFADLAWRDWRASFAFVETECTIVGATIDVEAFNSPIKRGRSEIATPLLALRYDVDGQSVHALGFSGPSHLLIGGGGGDVLAQYREGDTVPCRYDPSYPRNVLVRWEPGLAYLFALLPLALLAIGIAGIVRAKSR